MEWLLTLVTSLPWFWHNMLKDMWKQKMWTGSVCLQDIQMCTFWHKTLTDILIGHWASFGFYQILFMQYYPPAFEWRFLFPHSFIVICLTFYILCLFFLVSQLPPCIHLEGFSFPWWFRVSYNHSNTIQTLENTEWLPCFGIKWSN